MNADVLGVCHQGPEVAEVAAEHGATGLGDCDHERVHRRAPLCLGTQQRCPSSEAFRWMLASIPCLPVKHSTSTIEGTTAGHS